MFRDSTTGLDSILEKTEPDQIDTYLETQAENLVNSDRPFAAYMRAKFKEKKISQQDIFRRADIPEQYGYRLIGQTKNTLRRDYILRFCFAAGFTLKETQRALKLYKMSELYSRVPRDAVLMIAFNRGMSDIDSVNRLLKEHDMAPLEECAHEE
ncbi:MAG: hypothetical protein LUG56_01975 [Lachnospiraceae bacterium]|nr:hypothetical protein [Lachnospiraceae bacterium]